MSQAVPRTDLAPRLGTHLPALDGLRGIAVLAVMLYHFNLAVEYEYRFRGPLLSFVRTGWCGVDLFFVLSGFLITGILLDAKGSPCYFRNFYARRALRIFPLYYAVLVVVFGMAPLVQALQTPKFQTLAENQLSLWLYYSNVTIALRERFYLHAEWVGLGHFWSLAVEEQFYLVWPAVVFLARPRVLIGICVACLGVALALRTGLVLAGGHLYAAYVLTPCRFDALALGALIATLARRPGAWPHLVHVARAVVPLSAAVMAALILRADGLSFLDPIAQTVGYSTLAWLFGGTLVLALDSPNWGIVGRLFDNAPLRFLGKYSYALYVFHPNVRDILERLLPVERAGRWLHSEVAGALAWVGLALLLCVLAAWLSWHLYEKHWLKLKRAFEYARKRSPTPDLTPVTPTDEAGPPLLQEA